MTALTRRDFAALATAFAAISSSAAGIGSALAQPAEANPILVIQFFEGGTTEGFDAIGGDAGMVGEGASDLPGRLFSVAGVAGGGLHVVDVWATEADYETYMQRTLGPALQRAGVPGPEVTIVPVHFLAGRA